MNFYQGLLAENTNGQNVIKGKSADTLEHCIKGLIPIVRVSDQKFLFGTSVKNVQLRSDKLLVQVGGGHIPVADHWRAVAVSETIKMNKLIVQQRTTASKITKDALERNGAHQSSVQVFMELASALDSLFKDQSFLVKAWSQTQAKEQAARNSKGKKKKGKTPDK